MYDRINQAQACGAVGAADKRFMPITEEGERGPVLRGFAASAPPPHSGRSEMASALDAQEKASYALMETVKALADKLSPVLSQSPQAESAGGICQGFGSPIANCVHANTVRIQAATELLHGLIRDLAV